MADRALAGLFGGMSEGLRHLLLQHQIEEEEKRRREEGQTQRSIEASRAFERGIRTPDQVGAEIGPRLGTPGISHAGTTLVESQPQTDPHSDPFKTSTLGHDQENRTGALDVLRRLNQQQRPSGAVAPTRPTDLGPNPRFTGLPTGDFQNIDELPSVRAMRTAEAEQARRAREREEQRAYDAQEFDRRQDVQHGNALERLDRTPRGPARGTLEYNQAIEDEARARRRGAPPVSSMNTQEDEQRWIDNRVRDLTRPRQDGYVTKPGMPYNEALRQAREENELRMGRTPKGGPTGAAGMRQLPPNTPVAPASSGAELPPEWEEELSALDPEEQQEYLAYLQNPESLNG